MDLCRTPALTQGTPSTEVSLVPVVPADIVAASGDAPLSGGQGWRISDD